MAATFHRAFLVRSVHDIALGFFVTILGAGAAAGSRWALWNREYQLRTIGSLLRTYRREETPEALARRLPYFRVALVAGFLMGVAVCALGLLTLIRGL